MEGWVWDSPGTRSPFRVTGRGEKRMKTRGAEGITPGREGT